MKATPQSIIETLHSITQVELDPDGCLLTYQEVDSKHTAGSISYITSFNPGSFTYDLLCLIEEHLKKT